jgi:DNA-binding CsgD family transcriptional regulator
MQEQVKSIDKRFREIVQEVLDHPEFNKVVNQKARKFAKRRGVQEHLEDTVGEVQAEIRAFARDGLEDIKQERFWIRVFERYFESLEPSRRTALHVARDLPLPRCIVDEISNLCSNLTPRYNNRTPRFFGQGQDQQIVHQEYRGCPGDRPSQDPLGILIEEEEAEELRTRLKQLPEAIASLREKDQEIMRKLAKGRTRTEIAEERGITVSAISQRVTNAKEKLRQWYESKKGNLNYR